MNIFSRFFQGQRLKRLENKFVGQRCFILGNGPSLKEQNLKYLRHENVFVTNWFVLHEEFVKMANLIYCASDPHLWNYGKYFHDELIHALRNKKDIMCIFFEESAFNPFRRSDLSTINDNIFFIKLNLKDTVWNGNFNIDITRYANWGFTVIIDLCLPVAYFLGFSEVYLMGCDCDYQLDKANDFSQSFFYDISQVPVNDIQYIEQQKKDAKAQEQLDKWIRGYHVVNKLFEKNNRKIYNAGSGGKLEVFERIQFESLFNRDSNE